MEEEKPFVFTPANGVEATIKNYKGKARAEFSNGDIYEGEYLNGQKSGYGIYEHASKTEGVPNNVYKGEFSENLKHGIGIMIYNLTAETKEEYYGEWKNGKKHGEGRYTYSNGDVYSGEWANGRKHGEGTYVFAKTQMRLKGEFHENKLLNGQWVYPNGTIYRGKFENNKPIGEGLIDLQLINIKKGLWTFANHNEVFGHYSQTKIPLPDDEKQRKTLNIKLEWTSNSDLIA